MSARWCATLVSAALLLASANCGHVMDGDPGGDDSRGAPDAHAQPSGPDAAAGARPDARSAAKADARPPGSADGQTPGDIDARVPAHPDAAVGGTGLDPDLALPNPNGRVCSQPGAFEECPPSQVCRFYDSQSGRCESCIGCAAFNEPCSASSDCDIIFSCYRGRCTSFCDLGSADCGRVEDCLDIGSPDRGVCVPGS